MCLEKLGKLHRRLPVWPHSHNFVAIKLCRKLQYWSEVACHLLMFLVSHTLYEVFDGEWGGTFTVLLVRQQI